MFQALRDLHARLVDLDKRLRKLKGPQLWSNLIALQVRALVDDYFRSVRPGVVAHHPDAPQLVNLDGVMQRLLEVSHKHALVTTVRNLVRDAASLALELEKVALLGQSPASGSTLQEVDRRIIDTLTKLIPSAALSYEQALRDLSEQARLSWRGPATDLREALRETLDHLAPDADVSAQPGFKLEKDTTGPTMKQKVRYVLAKRGLSKSASETSERAASSVDEIVGAFVRSVYTRSNISTHTPTDKGEVLRVRDWVRVALSEVLEIRV
jgi:Predicted pPIWI-associating nuclease